MSGAKQMQMLPHRCTTWYNYAITIPSCPMACIENAKQVQLFWLLLKMAKGKDLSHSDVLDNIPHRDYRNAEGKRRGRMVFLSHCQDPLKLFWCHMVALLRHFMSFLTLIHHLSVAWLYYLLQPLRSTITALIWQSVALICIRLHARRGKHSLIGSIIPCRWQGKKTWVGDINTICLLKHSLIIDWLLVWWHPFVLWDVIFNCTIFPHYH